MINGQPIVLFIGAINIEMAVQGKSKQKQGKAGK